MLPPQVAELPQKVLPLTVSVLRLAVPPPKVKPKRPTPSELPERKSYAFARRTG